MKTKTYFKTAKFEDKNGEVHHITVACVMQPADNELFTMDELSIGVSICNPTDAFNEQRGKVIAEGKAMKDKSSTAFAFCSPGMIGKAQIDSMLERQIHYITKNFESFAKIKIKEKENVAEQV